MRTSSESLEHRRRYLAALLAYQDASRVSPNRDWRTLLYLLTALNGLWEATKGRLDFASGTTHLDPLDFEDLSTAERALLALAINLFTGRGAVNVARLIGCLDSTRPGLAGPRHGYPPLPGVSGGVQPGARACTYTAAGTSGTADTRSRMTRPTAPTRPATAARRSGGSYAQTAFEKAETRLSNQNPGLQGSLLHPGLPLASLLHTRRHPTRPFTTRFRLSGQAQGSLLESPRGSFPRRR